MKWLGHVKRMSGELFSEKFYKSEVDGKKDSGRLCKRWLDRVKKECNARSLELRYAKVMCMLM